MASTLSEIRANLRDELTIDPNGKIWSDSVLNSYINNAYLQIQKDGNYKWRENASNTTFDTIVGTQEYALPSDFIRLTLVRYNNNVLIPSDKITLKRQQNTFVNGQPSQYYIYGTNVGFDTIPNAVKEIDFDYQKKLAKLSDDTDTSELPEDFDDTIVKYASFLAWSTKRGNESTSANKLNEYRVLLDTLVNAYIFSDDVNLRFSTAGRRVGTGSKVLDR